MDNESLDVNQGSAVAPVTPSVTEETPAPQAEEVEAPEKVSTEPAADESASDDASEPSVPYSRFKEVNDQLKAYRSSPPVQVPVNPFSGYKSYDPQFGAPTDPIEYADWVAKNAVSRAVEQTRTSLELDELSSKYSEDIKNPAFVGAVVAMQRDAAQRGERLSFAKAAERVQDWAASFKKQGFEEARAGEIAKTSAATTRSKSGSSTAGGNIKKLSVDEFAALPKSEQRARYPELLASLQSEE